MLFDYLLFGALGGILVCMVRDGIYLVLSLMRGKMMVQELRALPIDVESMESFTLQLGNAEVSFKNGMLFSNKPVKNLVVNGASLVVTKATSGQAVPDAEGEGETNAETAPVSGRGRKKSVEQEVPENQE